MSDYYGVYRNNLTGWDWHEFHEHDGSLPTDDDVDVEEFLSGIVMVVWEDDE